MEDKQSNIIYDRKDELNVKHNTVFTVAKEQYESLVDYLSKKIFPGRVGFEKDFENTEFSIKRGLVCLDIIIQYSLLEISYKRGFMTDEVIQSFEGICRFGSLLDEIRNEYPFFSWTDFNELTNNECGEILKSLANYIDKVSRDFASYFIFVNPSREDLNFRAVVQEKLNTIINVIDVQNMQLVGADYRQSCLANAIFNQLVK